MPDRNADGRGLSIPRAPICPRFDACDPRCGSRTTLGHLDEVFRFCTSDYESCPIFAGSAGSGVASALCAKPDSNQALNQYPEQRADAGDCAGSHAFRPTTVRQGFASCEGSLSGDLIGGAGVAEIVRDAVELTIRGVRVLTEGRAGTEGDCSRDTRLQHATSSVHDLCPR